MREEGGSYVFALGVMQKQDNVGQSFSEVLKSSHSRVVFVII